MTKKELSAEDFPDIRRHGDGSFLKRKTNAEYSRQGQIENRAASGLNTDTGSPSALVYSKKAFTDDAIKKASRPIPANSRLAEGKFTKEDKRVGQNIKEYDSSVRRAYAADPDLGGKYSTRVSAANARLDRKFKTSRGFSGKR